MGGTPIFDELRNLFATLPDRFGAQPRAEPDPARLTKPSIKIIIAGGPGAGKTTFVGSVSDTHPIAVEAATDFGRITLQTDLVLYLFGTSQPGHPAFAGALGAVVLVDPRRIEDAFAMINYFENSSGVPFIVAVTMVDGGFAYGLDEIREALALHAHVPVTACDARDPHSASAVLQQLVSHTLKLKP